MNSRFKLKVAAIGILLGAAGCAGNRPSDTRGVSASNAALSPAVSFQQADLDGDARITPREFQAWVGGAGAARGTAAAGGTAGEDGAFYAADRNLNGVLTLDEWLAMPQGSARPTAPEAPGG
jgi:hypothetical protein